MGKPSLVTAKQRVHERKEEEKAGKKKKGGTAQLAAPETTLIP